MSLATKTTPASQQLVSLVEKHRPTLDAAVDALFKREFYAHFPEIPKAYDGKDAGEEAFQNQVGKPFSRLLQSSDTQLSGEEVSPYTTDPLGIAYPAFESPNSYAERGAAVFPEWKDRSPEERAALLIESLEQLSQNFFELAHATMHTTGQGFMMSFQASGPHGSDRALEAVALGYREQTRFPAHASWEKPMGKTSQVIEKYYKVIPKGLSLTVTCSTFPVWNAMPGIYASLVTGNPVIVKPHPMAVYPMALIVSVIQDSLNANGLPPEIIQLAPDTQQRLITKDLAGHEAVKLIDFTGSTAFGDYLERLPGKTTFTEKAGVNSVIIDSAADAKEMGQNLAFSVSLYSGQMCTAPQNFFIPKDGIETREQGKLSYDEVVAILTKSIKGLCSHEKAGPAVCGAVQSQSTKDRLDEARKMGANVLLEPFEVQNPDFPKARTTSPIVLEVPAGKREVFAGEMFGPIVFVIPTESTAQSIELASELARQKGAITCAAYTTNEATQEEIADKMADAYTNVAFNLQGQVYVNQNAAFSDPHATGGNPAANASLTDPEFLLKRFRTVSYKVNPV